MFESNVFTFMLILYQIHNKMIELNIFIVSFTNLSVTFYSVPYQFKCPTFLIYMLFSQKQYLAFFFFFQPIQLFILWNLSTAIVMEVYAFFFLSNSLLKSRSFHANMETRTDTERIFRIAYIYLLLVIKLAIC